MSATTEDTAAGNVPTDLSDLRSTVQACYRDAARRVADGQTDASCCGPASESSGYCGATRESWEPITVNLYDEGEAAGIPAGALLSSLGFGNTTALAPSSTGSTKRDCGCDDGCFG